jgi:hypothetical protein
MTDQIGLQSITMIIDQKIKQGYDKQIIAAMSVYFKVPEAQISVQNDEASPKHTLLFLKNVDASKPKIKMRLSELELHQGGVDIVTNDGETLELRLLDTLIEELTEKYKPTDGTSL